MDDIPAYFAWPLIGMVALFGLHYLLGTAPAPLEGVENPTRLSRRHRLRHVGGVLLMLMAAMLILGMRIIQPQTHPILFLITWAMIAGCLMAVCILAIADVRLTLRTLDDRKRARDKHIEP